jgi:hypothetical protein
MLFVQDSALVEDEKDVISQSPGPNQFNETFTLEVPNTSESGGRRNPSESEGKSGEESDLSQNEVDDTMKKEGSQQRLSKLLCFFVVLSKLCNVLSHFEFFSRWFIGEFSLHTSHKSCEPKVDLWE